MMGVNTDNLDTLIKKNNLYLSSYNQNSKKLISCIRDLNSCYSGNSLVYLFNAPGEEIKNIETIPSIISNYSDTLYQAKVAYKNQDEVFKTQINHINSNL